MSSRSPSRSPRRCAPTGSGPWPEFEGGPRFAVKSHGFEGPMRSKAVVGNWKLNGSLAANEVLLGALLREIPREGPVACAVCVPGPYLAQARSVLEGSGVAWGAQDVSRFDKGAYTGEVSGTMLADFGCRYAIGGHCERRTGFGETDSVVADKCRAARRAKATPII